MDVNKLIDLSSSLASRTTILSRRKITGGKPRFRRVFHGSQFPNGEGGQARVCYDVTWNNDKAVSENHFQGYGFCVEITSAKTPGDLILGCLPNMDWHLGNVLTDGRVRDAVTNELIENFAVTGVVLEEREFMTTTQLAERVPVKEARA